MISWALLGFKGHYFVIGPSFGQAHYGKDKMDLYPRTLVLGYRPMIMVYNLILLRVIRCVSEGFSNFASEHLVTYPLAEVSFFTVLVGRRDQFLRTGLCL